MEYRYKLKGLENLNEKDFSKLKTKILKSNDVEDVTLNGDEIILSCAQSAYEYDVLQELIALTDEFSIEVVFGDENDDNRPIDGDIEENNESADEKIDDNKGESDTGKKEKNSQEEFDYDDKMFTEKKTNKKDLRFRLGELAVSLLLFIASLFFEAGDSVFSMKMILLILSFSVSGYDVVFNAGVDIYKKKFLNGNLIMLIASIALIVLGEPNAATLLICLFAAAKFVESYSLKISQAKKDDLFYTGSIPLNVDGQETLRKDIKSGNVVTVGRGDRIPTDGVLSCDGEVSSYKIDYDVTTERKAGDKVLAGSIVISQSITYLSTADFGCSLVDEKKTEYENTTENIDGEKTKKWSKIGLYADLLMIFVSLLTAFLLPLTADNYKMGLLDYGVTGSVILAVSMISLAISNVLSVYKNVYADGRSADLDFKDLASIKKLGGANTFKVSAKALCDFDNEVCLKPETLDAIDEITFLGIKKIVTDFDCQLPDSVKDKIDFIEPTVKKEKQFYFSENAGDISYGGDSVKILSKDLSMVPLAYRMAKKAKFAAKLSAALAIASKVLLIAGAFLLKVTKFNVAYLAVIGGFVCLIQSLIALLGFTKNK